MFWPSVATLQSTPDKQLNRQVFLLTLSTHAREGSSSHFVCVSVCFFIVEKAPFSGLKLTSVHSRWRFKCFKCTTFLKIEAIWGKSEWNFGRNCSDLLGQCPVIKRFSTWSFSMSNPLPKLSFLVPALVSSLRVVISMVAGLLTAFLSCK